MRSFRNTWGLVVVRISQSSQSNQVLQYPYRTVPLGGTPLPRAFDILVEGGQKTNILDYIPVSIPVKVKSPARCGLVYVLWTLRPLC